MDIFLFKELRKPSSYCYVSLPNAQTAEIVGLGDIELNSGMMLRTALCVPKFKYNLLSISRLAKDSHIRVVFYDGFYLIQDYANSQINRIGKEAKGLYYLLNLSQSEIQHYMVQLIGNTARPQPKFRLCSGNKGNNTRAFMSLLQVIRHIVSFKIMQIYGIIGLVMSLSLG